VSSLEVKMAKLVESMLYLEDEVCSIHGRGKEARDLGEIRERLECGVYVVSKEKLVKSLPYNGFRISVWPPNNPHLVKGIDHLTDDCDSLLSSIASDKKGRYKLNAENLSCIYCHGMDGMLSTPPIADLMFKGAVESQFRGVPVFEVVRRILKEEPVDVLVICNDGGYPKEPSQYPFLKDMIYPRAQVNSLLNIYKSGRFVLSGYHCEDSNVPERFLKLRGGPCGL
jgi:hypothetical protein